MDQIASEVNACNLGKMGNDLKKNSNDVDKVTVNLKKWNPKIEPTVL